MTWQSYENMDSNRSMELQGRQLNICQLARNCEYCQRPNDCIWKEVVANNANIAKDQSIKNTVSADTIIGKGERQWGRDWGKAGRVKREDHNLGMDGRAILARLDPSCSMQHASQHAALIPCASLTSSSGCKVCGLSADDVHGPPSEHAPSEHAAHTAHQQSDA